MDSNTHSENNVVTLVGEVVSDVAFSHEAYGETFYTMEVAVSRLSGTEDFIRVMASGRLKGMDGVATGCFVKIDGQFRSHNVRAEEGKGHLDLFLFARKLEILEEIDGHETNSAELEGFVCRKPVYRVTPLGREIADMLIAVNRAFGKSDYLPCIVWGRNASFAEGLEVGDLVHAKGRIQSRTYNKKISETEVEERVAYEVSLSSLVLLEKYPVCAEEKAENGEEKEETVGFGCDKENM